MLTYHHGRMDEGMKNDEMQMNERMKGQTDFFHWSSTYKISPGLLRPFKIHCHKLASVSTVSNATAVCCTNTPVKHHKFKIRKTYTHTKSDRDLLHSCTIGYCANTFSISPKVYSEYIANCRVDRRGLLDFQKETISQILQLPLIDTPQLDYAELWLVLNSDRAVNRDPLSVATMMTCLPCSGSLKIL